MKTLLLASFLILPFVAVFSQQTIEQKMQMAASYEANARMSMQSQLPAIQSVTYTVSSINYAPYPFAGIDSTSVGTDDIWSTVIPIGFNFCYYDSIYTKLLVGSNGQVCFDTTKKTTYDSWSISSALPNTLNMPGNTICAMFRDIDPSTVGSGTIYYLTSGTAPNRKFVVSWVNIPLFSCTTLSSTFQLALYETTGNIEVYIQKSPECHGWNGGYGIVGIENKTGTIGLCPANRNYPDTFTAVNEAWKFTATNSACSQQGVNESDANNFIHLFPNPSTGIFSVEVNSGNSSLYKTEIYNVFGELVYSTSNAKRQTSNEIDLSAQPNGIYFLQVKTEQGTANKKLIIQK